MQGRAASWRPFPVEGNPLSAQAHPDRPKLDTHGDGQATHEGMRAADKDCQQRHKEHKDSQPESG